MDPHVLPDIDNTGLGHFQDVYVERIIELLFVGEIMIDEEMHAQCVFVSVLLCFDGNIPSFFHVVLEAPAVLVHSAM